MWGEHNTYLWGARIYLGGTAGRTYRGVGARKLLARILPPKIINMKISDLEEENEYLSFA